VLSGTTKSLKFDKGGLLSEPAPPDSDPATDDATSGIIALEVKGLKSGAHDMKIDWNLFDAQRSPLLTQFAQNSAASATTQDGHASAEIVSVGMADGGRIVAQYANGEQNTIATLAMALVANPESLTAVGNNNYRPSADTATPSYGLAGTGGRGKIKAGNLEASTVDIAREFTNLIVYQRGYQANSRVITTADEISQETLNLKR
jgi:flagellar hook protein FlgE